MKENIAHNSGILKEKELLEKLIQEISRDFSIGKKLAKKLIYRTHLSLDDLKGEIHLEQKENSLEQKNANLDDEKLNKLLSVLDGVRRLIEQSSKNEIEELKNILQAELLSKDKKESFVLENNNLVLNDDPEIFRKILSKKLINRAQNPKNMSDQIIGITLGISNSTIIITEVLYNLGRGIITSIPDFISIIKAEGEIKNFRRV